MGVGSGGGVGVAVPCVGFAGGVGVGGVAVVDDGEVEGVDAGTADRVDVAVVVGAGGDILQVAAVVAPGVAVAGGVGVGGVAVGSHGEVESHEAVATGCIDTVHGVGVVVGGVGAAVACCPDQACADSVRVGVGCTVTHGDVHLHEAVGGEVCTHDGVGGTTEAVPSEGVADTWVEPEGIDGEDGGEGSVVGHGDVARVGGDAVVPRDEVEVVGRCGREGVCREVRGA